MGRALINCLFLSRIMIMSRSSSLMADAKKGLVPERPRADYGRCIVDAFY